MGKLSDESDNRDKRENANGSGKPSRSFPLPAPIGSDETRVGTAVRMSGVIVPARQSPASAGVAAGAFQTPASCWATRRRLIPLTRS